MWKKEHKEYKRDGNLLLLSHNYVKPQNLSENKSNHFFNFSENIITFSYCD